MGAGWINEKHEEVHFPDETGRNDKDDPKGRGKNVWNGKRWSNRRRRMEREEELSEDCLSNAGGRSKSRWSRTTRNEEEEEATGRHTGRMERDWHWESPDKVVEKGSIRPIFDDYININESRKYTNW